MGVGIRVLICTNRIVRSIIGENMSNCLYCGSSLLTKRKFCDTHCQMEYQHQVYIENWKNGLEDGMRGSNQISLHIRRFLLEKFNYSCSQCGWNKINPYSNKICLKIEHKDGNFRNNKEENLDVLCPNCHSLTSTYKALNIGNGRDNR